MGSLKSALLMAERIVLALGALACVLVWLGIKPQEVTHMTWPHWIWLILGLALFTVSLYSSIRSFRIQAIDLDKSKKENASLKQDIEKVTRELDSVKTDLAAEQLLGTSAASPWLRSEGTEPAGAHADCIRTIPARHLKLEDCARKNSCFLPYTDRVSVILTNDWDTDLEVWSPVWESEEVAVKLPLGNCLEQAGFQGWQEDDWSAGSFPCLTVAPARAFRVSLDLRTVSGDGITIRLRERKTGCLLFPIKIGGRLHYEKVKI
jgi:hypothetical protein